MKRILSLFVVGVILLSAVVPAFAEDSEKITVSLEKAIELATENSIAIKNYENNILIAERNLKSAQHEADIVKLDKSLSSSAYLTAGKTKEYTPVVKERTLEDLKTDKEKAVQDLQISVVGSYYTLYNQMLSMETLNDNLEVQKEELESKKKELSLGLTTKNSVLDLENNIATAELEIKKAKWNLEMAQMDLAKTLGVDLNTIFILTDNPELLSVIEYDVEALVEKAVLEGTSVSKAQKDLDMKKLEKEVETRYTLYKRPEGAEDFDKSIADLEKALADAKVTEEVKIRSDYNSILSAQLDLEISKLKLEIAERTLSTNQLKYDLGMLVYLDVVKNQNSVADAKLDIQTKELNLYKLVEAFNYYIQDFNEVSE